MPLRRAYLDLPHGQLHSRSLEVPAVIRSRLGGLTQIQANGT